jgi:DNA replication and repair protein RecF
MEGPMEEGLLERKIGVSKFRSKKSFIKLDQETVKTASELAKVFPVIAIDPSSFELLEGGPSIRRSMLDWLVFHVKPDFLPAYKDYSKCLKQRNILLRSDKIVRSELLHWDRLLCHTGAQLEAARVSAAKELVETLNTQFLSMLDLDGLKIDVEFRSGWPRESQGKSDGTPVERQDQHSTRNTQSELDPDSLLGFLDLSFDRDKQQGFSSIGSHKFDLQIKADSKPAAEILSRGQKKQLVICLYLSLAKLFYKYKQQRPVFLLDDLPSELDSEKLAWLLETVNKSKAQAFLTTIDASLVKSVMEPQGVNVS